ncbi:MAG: hypothetical protein CVT89_01110 [Candidatus Altiarchaeales archaeon HGW-Altiarchaeales-2]|nr:MAG: hypothetical protein CVT89_01110 [Candidatus Altiarchaeales archaeon HGW-Altiarchaeales-2]
MDLKTGILAMAVITLVAGILSFGSAYPDLKEGKSYAHAQVDEYGKECYGGEGVGSGCYAYAYKWSNPNTEMDGYAEAYAWQDGWWSVTSDSQEETCRSMRANAIAINGDYPEVWFDIDYYLSLKVMGF